MGYWFFVQYIKPSMNASPFPLVTAESHALAAQPCAADLVDSKVVKRLRPDQRGALKLGRRYGDALVCVRYRHSADGRLRFTTIELVVDQAPVMRRSPIKQDPIVLVRLPWMDQRSFTLLIGRGATWHRDRRIWSMPESMAKSFGPAARIVSP